MDTTARTWKCPRCETVALAGQRFCRQCGHQHEYPTGGAAGATTAGAVPARNIRPVSRALIVAIVVLFALIGGLIALLVNDVRGDPAGQPRVPAASAAIIGTRPMTNTD